MVLRAPPAAPSKSLPPVGVHRRRSFVSPPSSRASSSLRTRRQRASDARNPSSPPTAGVVAAEVAAADDDDPPSSSTSAKELRSSRSRLPRSLSFRVASPGADLRAAASLRALAFSTSLPVEASGFAREAYVRTRSREAWDALEARAKGTDEDYAGCECLCLLGTIEDLASSEEDREDENEDEEEEEDAELARAVRAEGDASCTLAAVAADLGKASPRRRRLAVASLDIIVGPRLPSEALVAATGGGEGGAVTADLANVSVAPAARRRGLGVALLSEAINLVSSGAFPPAASSFLPAPARVAVHAEARNAAARALYEHRSLGFELEREEGLEVESLRGRPRRVLYSRPVVPL